MNVLLFGFICLILFGITVFWCAWAYNNDKLSPFVITVIAMIESVFITTCFFYVFIVTLF